MFVPAEHKYPAPLPEQFPASGEQPAGERLHGLNGTAPAEQVHVCRFMPAKMRLVRFASRPPAATAWKGGGKREEETGTNEAPTPQVAVYLAPTIEGLCV